MFDKPTMPDVASNHRIDTCTPIDWVGMDGITVPLRTSDEAKSESVAKVDAYVNLDHESAKGIHMSRLFLLVQERLTDQVPTQDVLENLLADMVASQGDISQMAKISLSFDMPLLKKALLSDNTGFQSYPVTLAASLAADGSMTVDLDVRVAYSSTCPCSAALSRQLLANKMDAVFADDTINKQDLLAWIASEEGSVATPHSQRSYAYIKLSYRPGAFPDIADLIRTIEGVMKTHVQTAVKREDEQEFARLNGENLMFCEDAARRLKGELEPRAELTDYWFKIEHQESLHAHNAVAEHRKAR